ncbi:MAG: DUF4352 domain-containing protein [Candidatus Marinimicrobia bacterium]|nr:DUF4352 domain-containing protein [Candidatus Neomarinimicrobiota bacterium]
MNSKMNTTILVIAIFTLLFGCAGTKIYTEQGQEVKFGGSLIFGGGFIFRITEAYWDQNYLEATPQFKYLIVKTAITNPQNKPLGIGSKYTILFRLIDRKGTEYAPETASGEFGMNNTINPGMAANGIIVFDIPDGSYALKTSVIDTYRYSNAGWFDKLIGSNPGVLQSFQLPLELTQK